MLLGPCWICVGFNQQLLPLVLTDGHVCSAAMQVSFHRKGFLVRKDKYNKHVNYLTNKDLNGNPELMGMARAEIPLSHCFLVGHGWRITTLNERGLSFFFNTIILQICFSPDDSLLRLPRSIWLIGANSPLHKCFLRAKGYRCHFCGLLPAVFSLDNFSLQTLLPLVHSLLPHHFTCFLPCAVSLCLMETGRVVVWGRGAGEGKLVCQVSYMVTAAK